MARPLPTSRGPFRADQLRSGDPYEVSNGHSVRCIPTGGWVAGASPLAVEYADAGQDEQDLATKIAEPCGPSTADRS